MVPLSLFSWQFPISFRFRIRFGPKIEINLYLFFLNLVFANISLFCLQAKNREIVSNWEQLVEKARLRKQKLDESYFLHRFLADFRDLTSWINDIKTVISADELAKVPHRIFFKGLCHDEINMF
jgi:hypothetical protein